MATMFTPPIDLYEEDQEAVPAGRDDREIGFSMSPHIEPQHLETHPRENGAVDRKAMDDAEERWAQILW